MKRKIALISAAVALAALMIAGGTLAWFTAADTAENTLTTGKVDVAINETMLSPTGGTEIAYTDPTGALVPETRSARSPGLRIPAPPAPGSAPRLRQAGPREASSIPP
jgi:predicted ribosomally synthesized peptide with SipW-like signal peptide